MWNCVSFKIWIHMVKLSSRKITLFGPFEIMKEFPFAYTIHHERKSTVIIKWMHKIGFYTIFSISKKKRKLTIFVLYWKLSNHVFCTFKWFCSKINLLKEKMFIFITYEKQLLFKTPLHILLLGSYIKQLLSKIPLQTMLRKLIS